MDQTTATAIRSALSVAARGQLTEACAIGEAALASGGDVIALNAMLGTIRLKAGEFQIAADHLRVAHRLRPDDVVIAVNLATALVELEVFEEALKIASEGMIAGDASGRLARVRAFSAQSMGQYDVAAETYRRILQQAPGDWESWNNLGNSCRLAEDLDGAIDALASASKIAPDSPPVRLNYASALADSGKVAEAERELRALARDFPDDWRSLRELHVLLRRQAREEEALEAIEEASRRSPADLELRLAVASQRLLLLDSDGAEAAYNEVISRDRTNSDANLGLAVTYEVANRSDDLSQLVEDVRMRGVDDEVVRFVSAFEHRRAKRYREGIGALEGVNPGRESARHAQLLGQLYDGAGEYDRAWTCFCRMNELQRADPSRPDDRAAQYRDIVRCGSALITPEWANNWSDVAIADGRSSPAFLLGFPRSGTTLLDTMLMSHPDVEVLEEESTLRYAGELLGSHPDLPRAPADLIAAARDGYFKAVAERASVGPGKVIIDKNPMYSVALPLIRRMFPDAKIILALRHPLDVALSCFTTNFKLNDGMASFLQLQTTAELYDLAFGYLERVQQATPMPMHTVRYENVVADAEGELRNVLSFLELPWDPAVLDHQKTAQERGRIKTASYAQVVEPIYSRSSGRWKNYRAQLQSIIPVLEPWIEKFGYESK